LFRPTGPLPYVGGTEPIAAGWVVDVGRAVVPVCTAVLAELPEQPAASIATPKAAAETARTTR